jgi:hypothetical protein
MAIFQAPLLEKLGIMARNRCRGLLRYVSDAEMFLPFLFFW